MTYRMGRPLTPRKKLHELKLIAPKRVTSDKLVKMYQCDNRLDVSDAYFEMDLTGGQLTSVRARGGLKVLSISLCQAWTEYEREELEFSFLPIKSLVEMYPDVWFFMYLFNRGVGEVDVDLFGARTEEG